MAPATRSLGLYDLLAPEFLAGFNFPSYIDQYLSLLSVADLSMSSDDTGVLYTGTVYFPTGTGNPPVTQHADPSGAIFEWSDVNFQFRLRVWREGSSDVQTAVNALGSSAGGLATLLDEFGAAGASSTGSDYPGLRFRLELLLSLLTFHLGAEWLPGVFDSTYHVVRDSTVKSGDVRVLLPKMLLRYEQAEDFSQAPTFALDSWGSSGFDAPSDLAEGELVSMEPPLAMHTSGRVAFGVQDIALDLSPNSTPPEILSHFGTGDDFEGVYIKALQFYYSDADKDFAFNVAVRDALISFKGEVWLEAELDLMFDQTGQPNPSGLTVTPRFVVANKPIAFNLGTAVSGHPNTYEGGSVAASADVYVQLQVSGGVPPYTYGVEFTPQGGAGVALWDAGQNQAHFPTPPTSDETGTLVITVTDSTQGTPLTYTNTMTMAVSASTSSLPNGAPQDTPGGSALAPATVAWDPRPAGIPDSYQLSFTPATSGDAETLVTQGGPAGMSATANGQSVPVSASGQILVEVAAGTSVPFAVVYPAQTLMPGVFNLLFGYDGPPTGASVSSYVAGVPSPGDPTFTGNVVPEGVPGDGSTHVGVDALNYFLSNALDLTQPISIEGRASYEGLDTTIPHNQALSERRLQVAQQIVSASGGTVGSTSAAGQSVAETAAGGTGSPAPGESAEEPFRVAIVTGTGKPGQPSYTLSGTLSRAASSPGAPTPRPTPATQPPPVPPAATNSSKPPSLKRLSFRVRLEKNVPVLMEISGEIDFQQQTQSALQQAPGSVPGGALDLQHTANATANPHAADTIVDFLLNVVYDTATANVTETLTLGAAPADQNGLLQMHNGDGTATGSYDRFKDIFGALLVFTPILNAATTAIDPNSAGELGDLVVSLAPPVAIGGLKWMNTVSVTLFGGSLVVRENIPSGLSSTTFTAASLTFDYGVTFRFDIELLNVHSTRDLSVRYKAVGFALSFEGAPAFKFVFDTSKGYTLDLSDPSLFNLPAPLGDLLKIAEARIAQHNPLTLEVDLQVKADLGVITVDEFQVKLPLDGSAPMILPSGIHLNVPGALSGGGKVHLQDGGFGGSCDLTVVPLSLRVAATLNVEHVEEGSRAATAVYLGVEVDFPTPIILGDTGLGIFGLFGLFGMHYTRNLPAPVAGSAVGPDLQWLINSGGQPQFLYNQHNTAVQNWVPRIDSWAFGIGALLGTVDGFLLNMRGMLVLELPGPQIIVTVNLKIVSELPGAEEGIDTDELTVGILGILDIDFNLGQITIGVSVELEVEELIAIKVPISIFFSWDEPDRWHVWLGTIQTPVSANILGIAKGSGYFMIGGEAIDLPAPTSVTLPGVAVALGIQASLIWGSESVGIYLAIVVGADIAVSFSPELFIVGEIHLSGQLRLLIVSIGASGEFTLEAPHPFSLSVKVCGSVSFFFFSVSACVQFTIGSTSTPLPPPALIGRMYLQSYAPVIPSGQGGSRPIDASLGDATETVASGLPSLSPASQASGLGPVPIDSVPVLQLLYAADATTVASTFTETLPQCPVLPTTLGGDAVNLGGGRSAVYQLKQISIDPPLPAGDPPPPVVWRKNTSSGDATATRVDLALFSRDPNLASHALERSTTLQSQLTSIWGGTCAAPAPPACVLWTFCGQRLGPSHAGWDLRGIPTTDPSGTTRGSPAPTAMHVDDPGFSAAAGLLGTLAPLFGASAYQPAQIIGIGGSDIIVERARCWQALELPELIRASAVAGLGKEIASELVTLDERLAGELHELEARLTAQGQDARAVRLEIGAATSVQLYLALAEELTYMVRPSRLEPADALAELVEQAASNALLRAAEQLQVPGTAPRESGAAAAYDVVVRERDGAGALLRESTLASLGPTIVSAPADLPAEWTEPNGPWWTEIEPLSSFFDYGLAALAKVHVQFAPLEQTTVIEIAQIGPELPAPTVVVGAVVACPASEQQRYETALQVQQSQISTLEGYLDGGSPVPLLAPNSTYTITVEYDVTTTEADGTTKTSYPGVKQGFTFSTDSAPPPKLDPWVMSCSPANNELNVFYEDPVTVVFNDQEAIQLWNAYGDRLVLELRAADGLNDAPSSVANTVSVEGFGPAGYDSLLAMVESGELPCVGSSSAYLNQQFTADVQLRPCMAYTLDIVTDPPAPPPPAGQVAVPLYRTRFTTSKYASLDALATDLGTSRIVHRHLSGPLSSLTAPTGGAASAANDMDIQSAFLAAGEQALPAPAVSTIAIYWAPGAGGAYVPYCLLLDCAEPLWRTREEPSLVPVDPSDPSFNTVEIKPTTALEVVETGGASIGGFLYSTAGTRTIAFFAPGFSTPAATATVTLALRRPPSQAFGLAEKLVTIVALPIGPLAPWEADNV